MPSFAESVRCPMCKRKQPKLGPDAIYYCGHCRGQFDSEPDEGGTFINNPALNAERKEDFENRNKGKRP